MKETCDPRRGAQITAIVPVSDLIGSCQVHRAKACGGKSKMSLWNVA
jgi:hypothetical protein